MGKAHEYCCCAIPLLNVGIYLTLIEQFTVGLLAGILAVATPQIVGADVPSYGQWLFAVGCFVACAVQALGFIGVFKENASLFKRFVQINAFVVSYIFSISAAWIILSATRHDSATNNCVATFFSNTTDSTTTDVFSSSGQGETVCNIFIWADIGIMGGLWLVMLIFQAYLLLVCRWYSTSQLADHSKYYSIYSVTAPEGIGLGERQQDAWDPRPSTESWSGGGGFAGNSRAPYRDHSRQNSDVTERAYGVGVQDFQKKPTYGYQDSSPGEQAYNPYISQPDQAYTSEVEPTPVALVSPERRYNVSQTYGSGAQPMAPPGAMYPNEGQFGRKTPRAEDAYANQGYVGGPYAPSTAPSYHTEKPGYYSQR